MRCLARLAAVTVVSGITLFGPGIRPASAQEATPLIIGTNQVLTVRTGDTLNGRDMSIEDRIGHLQDVFAKYLGGQHGKFTSKKWGDRVHLYLNGEFVLAVTPADARATGYKTAAALAPVWHKALEAGFAGAHVRATRAAGR